MPSSKTALKQTAAVLVLVCSLIIAIAFGAIAVSVSDVLRILGQHLFGTSEVTSSTYDSIVWQIRVPRVVLAALVGAALATAGASFQGAFRNPLADPYLLGTAAGAGIGATIAIGYLNNPAFLTPLAFAGAILGVGAAWFVGTKSGGLETAAVMVLAGVAVTSFLTAIQTMLQQQRTGSLQQVYGWILGQLSTSGWSAVGRALPGILIGSALLLLHARTLDKLELGDDKARTLGVPVTRARLLIVLGASLATASAVAVSGLIAFVGLVIPHIVRRLFGTSYVIVLPMCFIVGAAFLVLTDLAARTVVAPAELPIGVITAFFGAPFFVWLLTVTRKRWLV